MPAAYTEFAIPSLQLFPNVAQTVGTRIYMPVSNAGICGVIDTTDDSYSTFAVTSRSRQCGALVGTRIYLPATSGTVCGVIETADDSYSEFAIPSRFDRSRFCVAVGTKLYYYDENSLGTDQRCNVIDTTTDTSVASIALPLTSGYIATELVGTELFLLGGTAVVVIDTTTDAVDRTFAVTLRNRRTSQLVGGTIYAGPAADIYDVIDTTTDAVTPLDVFGAPPSALTSTLIGSKLYLPEGDGSAIAVVDLDDLFDGYDVSVDGDYVDDVSGDTRSWRSMHVVGDRIYMPTTVDGWCGVITLEADPPEGSDCISIPAGVLTGPRELYLGGMPFTLQTILPGSSTELAAAEGAGAVLSGASYPSMPLFDPSTSVVVLAVAYGPIVDEGSWRFAQTVTLRSEGCAGESPTLYVLGVGAGSECTVLAVETATESPAGTWRFDESGFIVGTYVEVIAFVAVSGDCAEGE